MENMIVFETLGSYFVLSTEEAKEIVLRAINKQPLNIEEFSKAVEGANASDIEMTYQCYNIDDIDDLMWEGMLSYLQCCITLESYFNSRK